MKTISLLNLKGGVAKTTTGGNIAKGLANRGFKTLLIDTDMQANATSIFLEDERSKEDYKDFAELIVDEKLEDVDQYVYNVSENLDMIGSSLAVAESELKVRNSFNRNSSNIVKKVLKKLDSKYDYCIIDCAPTINLITLNIIIASDEIIIPIKIDKFALEGYRTTLKNINQIIDDYELDTEVTVLYTMVNRNNIDKQFIIDEYRELGDYLLDKDEHPSIKFKERAAGFRKNIGKIKRPRKSKNKQIKKA
mgnify:CR=1 FL=1